MQVSPEFEDTRFIDNLLFRKIVEGINDLIYICAKDNRILYMNPAMVEKTGRDATGDICYKALHARNSICPWCDNTSVRLGKSIYGELGCLKGEHVYHVENVPISNEEGTIANVSILQDITDSWRIEDGLREEKKIRELVLNSLPGIFFLMNEDLHLICWNKNLEEISGYSTEELTSHAPHDFFAEGKRADCGKNQRSL